MRARSIKSMRHLFISWALLFISYYSWEDGLNCFSNGIWISYPPYLFRLPYKIFGTFLPNNHPQRNPKRRKYTNEIQNKHFRDITENMHTSFHPRQFWYHLALGTPNRKHIEEPEAPPIDIWGSRREMHISKCHTKKLL